MTELTRRKHRTNSQYPVEHVNDRIGLMGLSSTTVSYEVNMVERREKMVMFKMICREKNVNILLPLSYLRKYCRCHWVNTVLNIGSNRSIVVVQPVELLHAKSIHSTRLSDVRLAVCYYTHNLLFAIALNWFAFRLEMELFFF